MPPPDAEMQSMLASEGAQVPGCALADTASEAAAGATQTRQLISLCKKAEYDLTAVLGALLGTAGLCPGPSSPFCLLINIS